MIRRWFFVPFCILAFAPSIAIIWAMLSQVAFRKPIAWRPDAELATITAVALLISCGVTMLLDVSLNGPASPPRRALQPRALSGPAGPR